MKESSFIVYHLYMPLSIIYYIFYYEFNCNFRIYYFILTDMELYKIKSKIEK